MQEDTIRPVLIRPKDPRYHTSLFCRYAAGNEWGALVDSRLDDLVVTTAASARLTRKKCSNTACVGIDWYWYGEAGLP